MDVQNIIKQIKITRTDLVTGAKPLRDMLLLEAMRLNRLRITQPNLIGNFSQYLL